MLIIKPITLSLTKRDSESFHSLPFSSVFGYETEALFQKLLHGEIMRTQSSHFNWNPCNRVSREEERVCKVGHANFP